MFVRAEKNGDAWLDWNRGAPLTAKERGPMFFYHDPIVFVTVPAVATSWFFFFFLKKKEEKRKNREKTMSTTTTTNVFCSIKETRSDFKSFARQRSVSQDGMPRNWMLECFRTDPSSLPYVWDYLRCRSVYTYKRKRRKSCEKWRALLKNRETTSNTATPRKGLGVYVISRSTTFQLLHKPHKFPFFFFSLLEKNPHFHQWTEEECLRRQRAPVCLFFFFFFSFYLFINT